MATEKFIFGQLLIPISSVLAGPLEFVSIIPFDMNYLR